MVFVSVVTAVAVAFGGGPVIPKGFLTWEAEARGPEWTVVTSKSTALQFAPCQRYVRWDKGRVAARVVSYLVEAEYSKHEQLVVYKDVKAAKAVMKGLRAQAARCAGGKKGPWVSPLGLGDEGLRMGSNGVHSGHADVVVRRGAAIISYGQTTARMNSGLPYSRFKKVVSWAENGLLSKVCDLPAARC
ncbi:hypothetical protein [Nonomuraea sp. NPDC050310]|uniref:hypothetical protein n=1 Tax=Nonomuraea sp. NPDC050310 TaxID=3154935 RepID=UPI0033EA40B5